MRHLYIVFLVSLCIASFEGFAQVNRYWSQNFNDGSSMLAGAVVGGGAGNAAIYYNPANISEITESSFALSVSLFSLDNFNMKNALGENLDLNRTKFTAQPRFVSYLLEMKKIKNVSFEIAFMNVANSNVRFSYQEDRFIDILKDVDGEERYFASYNQENIYKDNYLGLGASYQLNEKLSLGMSLFVSIKTLFTGKALELDAIPLSDSIIYNGQIRPGYTASYNKQHEIRFQNYSALFKIGIGYRFSNLNLGFNFTAPSMNLLTSGKSLHFKQQQSNITNPDGTGFLPDYTVVDQQEKSEMKVKYKMPFSISMGATFNSPSLPDRSFFFSAEYFSSLKSYTIVDASPYDFIIPEIANIESVHFLDYRSAARNILNIAIGYRWHINKRLLLLSGFKTDFSYAKDVIYENQHLDNFNMSLYHLTSGLRFNVGNSTILLGIQYSYGNEKNLKQVVNLSDPVEYNTQEMAALQSYRMNDMQIIYNGVSFFLGAAYNFKKYDDK